MTINNSEATLRSGKLCQPEGLDSNIASRDLNKVGTFLLRKKVPYPTLPILTFSVGPLSATHLIQCRAWLLLAPKPDCFVRAWLRLALYFNVAKIKSKALLSVT